MAAREQDLDAIAAEILAALDGTLDDFIVARETEGQALKALIEQRLEGVTAEVVKVRAHMPEILQWQRERLVAKLEDAQCNWKTTVWSRSWFCWHNELTLPKSWTASKRMLKRPTTF